MIVNQQTLIGTFEPEKAVETLPFLLEEQQERALAVQIVQFIAGPIAEMSPHTLSLLQRFCDVLELPHLTEDVLANPLAKPAIALDGGRRPPPARRTRMPSRFGSQARARRAEMRLVNRTFDEVRVGDSARDPTADHDRGSLCLRRGFGNHNPMHLADSDLDGDGVKERDAPGMFVGSLISAVLGMQLPGPGTLYLSQSLVFHARVHAGEEVIASVEVLDKMEDSTVRLQTTVRRANDGRLILSGEAVVQAPTEKFDRGGVDVPGLVVQRHRHFEALLERAKPLPAIATAVVCPDDENSLGGAVLAAREGIIAPILIGNAGSDPCRSGQV